MIEQIKSLSASRWYPGTQRFLVAEALAVDAIFDCENGLLHEIKEGRIVAEIEATPERLQQILDWLEPLAKEQQTADLIERLKEIRNRHWTGGCNIGPVRIQTDQESISNLTGAYTFGKEFDSPETPFAITWSLGQGQSVTLDLPTLRQACAAVIWHIQSCNTRYLDLYSRITDGEDLLKIEVDLETGWPE